jgi:predicted Zn finger-like uncharacterized protein
MVIQCSSCNTRFKISDDKMKNGAVKVRCSKCKEVFTVQPAEEEQAPAVEEEVTTAPAATDAPSPSLDDVDWGSLNSSSTENETSINTDQPDSDISSSDFSFGDEQETVADDKFAFGDEEPSAGVSDEFSFGDDEAGTESESDGFSSGEDDAFSFADDDSNSQEETAEGEDFSFGESKEPTADDFGFDDPIGEGAQDEFSFDDTPAPTTDAADDFDWDGSSAEDTEVEDEFGFGESAGNDDNLDFSGLEMAPEESSPLEIEEEPQKPASPPPEKESRPTSVKGPQKSGAKGRTSRKKKKTKRSSGPLGKIITFLLLLTLLIGGGLYGLKQMGFWSGNIEELQTVDYVTAAKTAWEKAMVQVNKLAGNEVKTVPVGTIAVTEMAGKYIQNEHAGMLFVIEGKIRNDYNSRRSATVVKGILYDEAGSVVQQKKAYCGNPIDDNTLRTATIEELQTISSNVFGDKFANDDVAPGASVPFAIVFSDLPENLSKFNVEVAESAAGSK